MKPIFLFLIASLFFGVTNAQQKQIIETSDIENFWRAYDQLSSAANKPDSIQIIQREYIDKSTAFFKTFIKLRDFKAAEYISLIQKYPKFWISIRKETEKVKDRKDEIEKIFDQYETQLPNFKRPNVCFAIGCLRTGGTVSDNLILIGTEIAASTPTTEKSELSNWLKTVIGTLGDIVAMVSHETIHTQQKNGSLSDLAAFTLNEGIADFLSEKVSRSTINTIAYTYGIEHDCELRKEFLADYTKDKNDLSNWLFNGSKSKNRPADLGYYIGYKIAEEYYNKAEDKKKAISDLLNRSKYKKIFNDSDYIQKGCS